MKETKESGRFDSHTKLDETPVLDEFKIRFFFNWMHWVIIFLSLILTIGAWKIASVQNEEKILNKFNLESKRIVELTVNRLQRYEDGLLGGIAAIKSHSFGIEHLEWRKFSTNLQIDQRYTGIRGIGIVFNVKPNEINDFLIGQRKTRPNFKVHPKHDQKEFWPITFIEPEHLNQKAVGLDMSHESNRYTAIKKARDTGNPHITGPITLVQDKEKTPGFLFYIPYYKSDNLQTVQQRQEQFDAIVYAPFVVKNLMRGVLSQEDRHVNIQITDGEDVLYDEISSGKGSRFDSKYKRIRTLNIYGREWTFRIVNNPSFDIAVKNSQPMLILVAGIIINIIVLLFFIFLKGTNNKALAIASELIDKDAARRIREEGSSKMATLGEMASGIAHEINNPVAIICGYATQLEILSSRDKYEKDKFIELSKKINATGQRISKIIKGLKSYSRDASLDPKQRISLSNIIDDTLSLCSEKFKNHDVKFETPSNLNDVYISCRPVEISQVLLNLLNNSYDAVQAYDDKWIKLTVDESEEFLNIIISDSGKSPTNIAEKIFNPFYTTKDIGKGTGLGLSICYGIINKHGGELFLDTSKSNTTFVIRFPFKARKEDRNG